MECGRNDNGTHNRNELNSDDDINGLHNEITTKEVVLRRPLHLYPATSSVRKTAYKHGLSAHVPRPGGFRVRHGFLVSQTRS